MCITFTVNCILYFSAEKLEELEEQQELNASNQPQFMRLVLSLWFAIISHSDLVCYFMIFLHQIKSATILSLPLPLMVFLWGTLTVPRPTKNFWVTLIAYTEVNFYIQIKMFTLTYCVLFFFKGYCCYQMYVSIRYDSVEPASGYRQYAILPPENYWY